MPPRPEASETPGSPFPSLPLSDGRTIPQLGLGIYKTPEEAVPALARRAVEIGYRHFDTASMYENEAGLGEGLRTCGLPREELFVTTKVWNTDHGYEETLAACARSLERLRTEYVDLYLIHWPAPGRGRYRETWRALEKLRDDGLVRSIGVSNFHAHHLAELRKSSERMPVVNQVECHPRLPQRDLIRFHDEHGIRTEAWAPLARGRLLQDESLGELARSLGRTPAQVVLRWHLQRGVVVIPKTVNPERLVENARILDFELADTEMAALARLETGERTGDDPDDRD
ncbi:aldo/keto reductase [Streptomyces oceani]|uniref:Oxidoreductase n=1 Tax=Streptomyces oceani TaxID=1075402 RepID=A0A1E7JWG8_9ACTN|nr:aldo/keto reductase [Streptomyces oceani]OEU95997.1 oxidoreductase [Streptomyces oceani]